MKTDSDKAEKLIPGNHANVRLVNRCVILNLIREEQPISRVAMGRMISLTKSTISNIVADLIEEGLVQEISVEKSTGGRKPTLLKLNSSGMICGAIAMLREKTLIGVVNLDGHILDHLTLPMAEGDPKRFIEFCAKHLAVMLQKLSGYTTLGIGVSVSGMVSQQDGRIISMPDPEWRNVSIRLILERMFNLPVMLDNDANVEALANLFYGTKSGVQDFVQVALRDGIGVGIVMNGRLLKGSRDSSIEFGHTVIREGGELCMCGRRGCWEAYASDLATIRKYNKLLDGNGNHEPPPNVPGVSGLDVKAVENGIWLDWNVDDAAIKYAVYRSKKDNVSPSTANLLMYVESPPFTDFAVEEGELYYYNVRALNLFEEGEVAEREASCRAPKITYNFDEEFTRETLQNYDTFGNKKPRVKNNQLKVGAKPPLQEDTVVYRRESYSDYVVSGRVKPGEIGSWDSAGIVVKVQSGEEWYYAMIAYGDYLLEKYNLAFLLCRMAGGEREESWLAFFPIDIDPKSEYNLKVSVVGERMQMKAWKVDEPEPTRWQLSVKDEQGWNTGSVGMRHFGGTATFSEFKLAPLNDLTTSKPMTYGESSRATDRFFDNILLTAERNDPTAIAALQNTARYIGLGLSNIYNGLGINTFYVTGKITEVWNLIEPTLMEALASNSLMNNSENIRVIPLHNADELGLKGCGVLVSKRLFEGFRIEPYRLA